MREGGRIQAAIEVLDAIENQDVPVKTALRDWGRAHRFAGSGDRAWIAGLVMDALRHRAGSAWLFETNSPRSLVLGALKSAWDYTAEDAAKAFEDDHAPDPLSEEEITAFAQNLEEAPAHIQSDMPDWVMPSLEKGFGKDVLIEANGFKSRAPVDLRVNGLKSDPETVLAAIIAKLKDAAPSELVANAIRIPQSDPRAKAPAAEGIPAYGKGWVEVQDIGSQIAALASGAKPGDQVLDYCAGAGGKTLALSALSQNKGQVHAWDIDTRRLRAIWPRVQRAGVRNAQVHEGKRDEALSELKGQMDIVYCDAPCTGSGTWRRRPESKWKLSPEALERRIKEQIDVLDHAGEYVKPGGRMVYVTCSILPQENGEQIRAFIERQSAFQIVPALDIIQSTGLLTEEGAIQIGACVDEIGAIQLTPARCDTDGFYVCVMEKTG